KVLVGGFFSWLGGVSRANLARLNADGSVDGTFNPGADLSADDSIPAVYCLSVQPDGKILVGGYFLALGGADRNSLGRLNPDGSVDATFAPLLGSSGWAVFCLAQQTDGKILVAADFALMDTTPHFYLTRLDRDGNLDTFFSPVMDAPLNALAVQADGEILLGGSFSTVNGQPRLNIARLNRTQPATESLSFDGSRATWLRGGSAAEIWRAEFEATTDGVNWTTLGV